MYQPISCVCCLLGEQTVRRWALLLVMIEKWHNKILWNVVWKFHESSGDRTNLLCVCVCVGAWEEGYLDKVLDLSATVQGRHAWSVDSYLAVSGTEVPLAWEEFNSEVGKAGRDQVSKVLKAKWKHVNILTHLFQNSFSDWMNIVICFVLRQGLFI